MRHVLAGLTGVMVVVGGLTLVGSSIRAEVPVDTLREILIREQSRNSEDGILIELTEDGNPEVRARAYRALGRLQDPSLLAHLTQGLKDKKNPVRLEAAFAIGQLFDPVAETIIVNAMEKEKEPTVRGRLVEALGKCGTESSVEVLAELLTDPDVGGEAALALGVLAYRKIDIDSGGQALNRALQSGDPELQWRAAFAAHRGRLASTISGLGRALRSQDALPLIYTAKAVGVLDNKRLAEKLMPLLKHEDWRVRVEGLRSLGSTRSSSQAPLASLLLEDTNEHVRLVAIETMGKMVSGGGLSRISQEQLDESSDWRIRSAVLKAKAQGEGEGALVSFRDSMTDPDWRIRKATVEAMGMVPTEQSLLFLERMVNDDAPQVQAAVVNALVVFPQRHAVEVIRPFLGSSDPAVVTSAANAAGQRHDLNAVGPLVAAYDQLVSPVDTEVMVAILEALGRILTATVDDDPVGTLDEADRAKAEALLDAARNDTDYNVAQAAADALSLVRGETVEPETQLAHEVPPQLDLDLALTLESAGLQPTARIVTNRGTVVIRLFGDEAPGTVANFIGLVRDGFYNGLLFHRVVPDFVVQGGDPRGDGWGGPGYAIRCEYNPLEYRRGRVGMALAGKDTGGSQFFMTHSPQPHLNGRYTIFGEVIEGEDVMDLLQVGDTIDEIQLEGI